MLNFSFYADAGFDNNIVLINKILDGKITQAVNGQLSEEKIIKVQNLLNEMQTLCDLIQIHQKLKNQVGPIEYNNTVKLSQFSSKLKLQQLTEAKTMICQQLVLKAIQLR